jgi:hypothetical protein
LEAKRKKTGGYSHSRLAAGCVNQILAAQELNATPYDIHGVELTQDGELCSFDSFLNKYNLDEPELRYRALIVRGADTDRHDLTPKSGGLFAISLVLLTSTLVMIRPCYGMS